MLFCLLLIFFQNQLFRKILSGIPSECETAWIQIRPDILSGLIWVQTVCKGYQQQRVNLMPVIGRGATTIFGFDVRVVRPPCLRHIECAQNAKFLWHPLGGGGGLRVSTLTCLITDIALLAIFTVFHLPLGSILILVRRDWTRHRFLSQGTVVSWYAETWERSSCGTEMKSKKNFLHAKYFFMLFVVLCKLLKK